MTDDSRTKDRPWLMRTYAGHSSAAESNALYRNNLSKGQTGLSVAFDLPTQTGYDPDSELARGEVGKVGVPVSHIGDMLDRTGADIGATRQVYAKAEIIEFCVRDASSFTSPKSATLMWSPRTSKFSGLISKCSRL